MIDTIIERFKRLQENYDFVVVEGTDFMDNNTNLEFDGNISIVRNLNIPAVVIVKGEGKSVGEITDIAVSTVKSFTDSGIQMLTVVANKIDNDKEKEIRSSLTNALPKGLIVTCIPRNKELGSPTMMEIVDAVKGKVLFGENHLTIVVEASIVGAMQLHNCLTRLSKNTLIVSPGDRGDIIIGALQANISRNYEKLQVLC